MIKERNHAFERMNEKLGISVSLPNPGKNTLKTVSVCHFAAGAGLAAAGVVFSSKWCAALGCISIISSVVLRKEGGGDGKK
ncbi:MAG: hypothetical protein HFF69_06875 [Oscillospiraceae bacterium]|jgi:hypothetical protein|nr:hypothetical protein [Oscillospiraceae bacterium]